MVWAVGSRSSNADQSPVAPSATHDVCSKLEAVLLDLCSWAGACWVKLPPTFRTVQPLRARTAAGLHKCRTSFSPGPREVRFFKRTPGQGKGAKIVWGSSSITML